MHFPYKTNMIPECLRAVLDKNCREEVDRIDYQKEAFELRGSGGQRHRVLLLTLGAKCLQHWRMLTLRDKKL